jgi:serine protease Do
MLTCLALASGLLAPACAQPDINAGVSSSRRNAITEAARKVSPAVVSIVVTQVQVYTYDPLGGLGFDEFFRDFFPRRQYRQEVKAMGSGVIISAEGDVITNAHVVQNATAITVTLPDNREFQAELAGIDGNLDIALLNINGKDLPVAEIGTSADLMIGEWAIAFGNPFGFLLQDAQPTVTVGVISALHRDVKSGRGPVMTDMIQTDAAINPGNSGGPLCTAEGRVVGINTFIFSHSGGSEGIGFARPIDDVRSFVGETRGAAAEQSAGYEANIGCTVADINSLLRGRHGLAQARGVVVTAVEPGTIAARVGLAPGDVVLLAQGKVCRTARAFQQLYEKLGSAVDIVVDRAGESIRLFYRIG